jgi:uncharacterized protein YaeQ
MKKILLGALAVLWLSSAAAAPGEGLLRQFSSTFPGAKYVRWTENEGHHVASFTWNDTPCRVWYDDDGSIVYSLRYSGESELPVKVLAMVKKKYHNRQVDGVVEISTKNGTSYELTLSDDKKWYVVSASAQGDLSLKYYLVKK